MTGSSRLDEVRWWLSAAKQDLEFAERLAAEGNPVWRFACYHAQQAAEKTLKGALIYLRDHPPHTHDLDKLRDRLPAGWQLHAAFPALNQLTMWEHRERYPDASPPATEQDARAATVTARRLAIDRLRLAAARIRYGS